MTDDELRKLAEAALADDRALVAKREPLPWAPPPDGVPLDPSVHGSVTRTDELDRIGEARHQWERAARTREPELARAVLRLLEGRARWPGSACADPEEVIAQEASDLPGEWVGRCCHGITSQGTGRDHAVEMTLEACAIAHESEAAP
jgi:hypothetical protein